MAFIPKAVAGSAVYLEIEVRDATQAAKPLFDPSEGVKVTIKNPSESTVVDLAAMTKMSVGVYSYTHQTDEADPLGPWHAQFKSQDGIVVHLSQQYQTFEVVAK